MFSQKKPSHCKNSAGVSSAIFLVTRFTKKILESSDSMYSSIFRLKNIWYYNFFWIGPNPEEILNFVPVMGPQGIKLISVKRNWQCKLFECFISQVKYVSILTIRLATPQSDKYFPSFSYCFIIYLNAAKPR